MSERTTSTVGPSQDGINRQFSWYEPELAEVKEPARTILAEYSKIPEEKIIDHVKEVVSVYPYYSKMYTEYDFIQQRDRAFAVVSLHLPHTSHRNY